MSESLSFAHFLSVPAQQEHRELCSVRNPLRMLKGLCVLRRFFLPLWGQLCQRTTPPVVFYADKGGWKRPKSDSGFFPERRDSDDYENGANQLVGT